MKSHAPYFASIKFGNFEKKLDWSVLNFTILKKKEAQKLHNLVLVKFSDKEQVTSKYHYLMIVLSLYSLCAYKIPHHMS